VSDPIEELVEVYLFADSHNGTCRSQILIDKPDQNYSRISVDNFKIRDRYLDMITISQISQNNSFNALHATSDQFDLFQVSDLPLDRRATASPTLIPPMPVIADTGPSFEAAFARYFKEVIALKRAQKGQDFVTSLLRSCILPVLGDRPLRAISRNEIREMIRVIGTTRPKRYLDRVDGRRGRANSTHWLLSSFFGWCADEVGGDLLEINPMSGLKQPYRDGERDRVLSPSEITYFWAATGELGYPFGTIARLLLLSGQRRGEIANAVAWQFDRSERLLMIPVNKSRRPHVVPLSTLALELLEGVPQNDPRALVFPDNRDMTIRSTYFRTANSRLSKIMLRLMQQDFIHAGRDPADAYIAPWVFHDLRRTCATYLARLGHPVEVIDRVLNHGHAGGGFGRTVNAATRVYCRHEALTERRDALQDFSNYVRKLVSCDAMTAEKR
jgi:integrase